MLIRLIIFTAIMNNIIIEQKKIIKQSILKER